MSLQFEAVARIISPLVLLALTSCTTWAPPDPSPWRWRKEGVTVECPSGDFLIPWNHLDSMDAFLIFDSRGPPVWTDKNRAKYNRDHLRYPSDLTDDEWAYVEPLIPPAKRGGGKRRTDMRAVMNGVMYILSTGCQWRYIPKDFPPRSTLHDYFTWWNCDGTLDRIHHALYVECREKAEREASPTACIIDSQSVKSAEKGGPVLILTGSMQAN